MEQGSERERRVCVSARGRPVCAADFPVPHCSTGNGPTVNDTATLTAGVRRQSARACVCACVRACVRAWPCLRVCLRGSTPRVRACRVLTEYSTGYSPGTHRVLHRSRCLCVRACACELHCMCARLYGVGSVHTREWRRNGLWRISHGRADWKDNKQTNTNNSARAAGTATIIISGRYSLLPLNR